MLNRVLSSEAGKPFKEPRVGVSGVVARFARLVVRVLKVCLFVLHPPVYILKAHLPGQLLHLVLFVLVEHALFAVQGIDHACDHLFAALKKAVGAAVNVDDAVDPVKGLRAVGRADRTQKRHVVILVIMRKHG